MKKILLVENPLSTIGPQRELLDRSDIKLFTASSGREALDLHKVEKMHLIVIDLNMTDIKGDIFCEMIRQDDRLRNVSILIMCRDIKAEIDRASACGANAFITVPIRVQDFFSKVGRLLNVHHRGSYRVLMKVSVQGKDKIESFFCSSVNISISGLLIETNKVLNEGDIILCSFFLPGANNVVTGAEIMRVVKSNGGPDKYGIRFTEMDQKSRSALEAFVKSRIKTY